MIGWNGALAGVDEPCACGTSILFKKLEAWQASKRASKQGSKQASKQASEHASKQASKQASEQLRGHFGSSLAQVVSERSGNEFRLMPRPLPDTLPVEEPEDACRIGPVPEARTDSAIGARGVGAEALGMTERQILEHNVAVARARSAYTKFRLDLDRLEKRGEIWLQRPDIPSKRSRTSGQCS